MKKKEKKEKYAKKKNLHGDWLTGSWESQKVGSES